jgi:acetyl-CoA carboxylase biotin carboxylase subunit
MKVLVANRGEIAVRIIRACRDMGLGVVAVYSDCDRDAQHVRLADHACHLGPGPAVDSYLRMDRIVAAARDTSATFVHPGYGFLAENAEFARHCQEAGLVFVGPTPQAIAQMGSKTAARDVARAVGVPVVPGTDVPFDVDAADDAVLAAAAEIGYPLLIKAVAGGGGKGMRTVSAPEDLLAALGRARSEAISAFGDGRCYLERRLIEPRHIEIQLLGDTRGTVVPFVERECSIQRRHQKVVEESPAAHLPAATRHAMADAATRIARAVGYTSAGTIEFLVDRSGQFYFLEMNTRLQVEHPVTEAVTGIDLVQWQLRIARGEPLSVDPRQAIDPRGHAIECRIYAEDPDRGFLPSPGRVTSIVTPGGPGVRNDRGVIAGDEIPIFYDPLIAKLTVWGETRSDAIHRLRRALDEYRVAGVRTTLPFFRWLVREPAYAAGPLSTSFLDEVLAARHEPFVTPTPEQTIDGAVVAAVATWMRGRRAAPDPSAPDVSRWQSAGRRERLR